MNIPNKILVSGFCDLGDEKFKCYGEFWVDKIDEKHHTAYVLFNMSSESGLHLCSFSRTFFLGENGFNKEEFIQKSLEKIRNYRSERKKIFSEINIQEK